MVKIIIIGRHGLHTRLTCIPAIWLAIWAQLHTFNLGLIWLQFWLESICTKHRCCSWSDSLPLQEAPASPAAYVCYDRYLKAANLLRLSKQRSADDGQGNMLGHVAGLEALLVGTGSCYRRIPVATHSQDSADLATSNSQQPAPATPQNRQR